MRAVLRLRVATIRLVLQFHDVHPDPSPAAAASLKRLTAHLDEAMRLEAEQQDRQREARGAVESRGRAEAELRARMVQLVRLSRVVAQQERLTDLTCQMRAGGRLPTTLMTDVADALARATRHRDVLQSYGLPEALLRELE